ncbi:MAG: CHAT domain-containing tetratricopeptide repeat protein [Planctomycetota bacterium]|nr:CHAT domain-containing tetratricopeptide repeat protein [Planctomycetota bacterium]
MIDAARLALRKAEQLTRARDSVAARPMIAEAVESLIPVESLAAFTLVNDLGYAANAAGDDRTALRAFEHLLAKKGPLLAADDVELQKIRQRLATILTSLGSHDRALELSALAVESLERTQERDALALAEVRVCRGNALNGVGEYDAALEQFEMAFASLERTLPPESPLRLVVQANLASTHMWLGHVQQAREHFESVIRIRERILSPSDPSLAVARTNLATVLLNLGDVPAMRTLLEAAIPVLQRVMPADHPQLLGARANLAVALIELGDRDAARAIGEDVLAIRERVLPEGDLRLQNSRLNLGTNLKFLGDQEGALRLFEKVSSVLEEQLDDDDPQVLRARMNVAGMLVDMGEEDRALELMEHVVASGANNEAFIAMGITNARTNLGGTQASVGQLDRARQTFEEMAAEARIILPPEHRSRLAGLRAMAVVLASIGDGPALAAVVEELCRGVLAAISAAEAGSPRETASRIASLESPLSAILDGCAGLEDLAFEVVESARIVASARPLDPESVPAELQPLFTRVREARAEVQRAADAREFDSLVGGVSARDEAESQLRHALLERGLVAPRATAASVARALAPGSAAAGFSRYEEFRYGTGHSDPSRADIRVVALLQTDRDDVVRVDIGTADRVGAAVERWRTATGKSLAARGLVAAGATASNDREEELAAGEALRALVLDPLMAAAPDARTFHVILDGTLHLVPLDALPLGDGLVGDRVRIHVETSFARLLAPSAPIEAAQSLLVAGGIDYDAETGLIPQAALPFAAPPLPVIEASTRRDAVNGAWRSLPGTLVEARAIRDGFASAIGGRVELLEGGAATKAAIYARAEQARWLHLATHGWFDAGRAAEAANRGSSGSLWSRQSLADAVVGLAPRTLCGLALAGANRGADSVGRVPGLLTAEELAGLDLSQCELAVLSACETNVGAERGGIGISSLQSALNAAGARTAITSLWKVDDEATRILFESFYARVWQGGEAKDRALWNAKQGLRAAGRPTRDWAGWILTGDPR